jgi:hypothetical protein
VKQLCKSMPDERVIGAVDQRRENAEAGNRMRYPVVGCVGQTGISKC